MAGNIACWMLRFAKSPITDVRFDLKLKLDLCILKIDTRSKYVIRRATYHNDIPMWISHHLSLVEYLEHIKIPPEESVCWYEIAWIGINNVSNPTPILCIDSSAGCGFFPSCPCVPTPNVHSDIWDHVESYAIQMFLACRFRITFKPKFKLLISKTESPFKRATSTYEGSTTLSFLVLATLFA